ncbi:response regulator [Roseimaritima sediminicola]|uniref:response regulator n=1 Tax=Roseimaritima sediminicola TaxID=2662066 RepID=UPI0012984721|nr:response regulator [Roseimaritima sediminicola]
MASATILVADDSGTVRTLVRRALVAAGFQVVTADNGVAAVAQFRQHAPELVILDIQMPEMDGYEACQQILAANLGRRPLPIVFLTRDTAQHLDALGSELGAYLPKPVCEQQLVETVRALLGSFRPASVRQLENVS